MTGLFVPHAAAATVFTLPDLFRLALERNEQILIAKEQVLQSNLDRNRAIAQVLPRISVQGSALRYQKERMGQFSDGGAFVLQPKTQNSVQLAVQQPLFSGGRLNAGLKIADSNMAISREDLRMVQEELLFHVASAAYGVLKAKRDLAIAGQSVNLLAEHRRVTERRFQVGELTRVALFRVEAELAGAEANHVRAQETLQTAREALKRLVEIPEVFEIKEPDAPAFSPPSLEEGVAGARASRPELVRARFASRVAEENIKIARSPFFPELFLEGIYARQDQDPRSPFFLEETTYAGLRLTFTLFEGGQRLAEFRQAQSRKRQADLQERAVEKMVIEEVRIAYANLTQSSASLEALNRQVTSARETYAMTEKLFRHGLATNLDLLDAHTSLIAAERDLARSAYDHQLAVLRVQKSMGRLSAHVGRPTTTESEP
jgi:outer membrane protein TolC